MKNILIVLLLIVAFLQNLPAQKSQSDATMKTTAKMTHQKKEQIPPSFEFYEEFWKSGISKLPAKWLQEVADAGLTFERNLLANADTLQATEKKTVSEADFNRCKFGALRELWEIYGRCERGLHVNYDCSTSQVVKNFLQCLEKAAN